jgi:hypothetical protein
VQAGICCSESVLENWSYEFFGPLVLPNSSPAPLVLALATGRGGGYSPVPSPRPSKNPVAGTRSSGLIIMNIHPETRNIINRLDTELV